MKMKIKICGITNLEDALAAADLGAEYLGFNFYPKSPRSIAELDCERISAALAARRPQPVRVGVFVNHPPADIRRIVERCGLNAVQLSGDEPPEALAALAADGISAFKAVRFPAAEDALAQYAQTGASSPALLLDASQPGKYGGTGRTADWDWARAVAARHPVFLAGGLTAENVAAAIRAVRPWGVDAASGVESAAGKKDRGLMEAFVAAARRAAPADGVRIEPAAPSDAAEILALQRIAFRSEAELHGDFSIPPLVQTLESLAAEFETKKFLRATEDGRLIGSVCGNLEGGTCRIGRLIVRPDRQNRGVGTRLLRAIEAEFPQAERFELFTGERSARNLHLYGRHGYREFRREPMNDRYAVIFLEKQGAKPDPKGPADQ